MNADSVASVVGDVARSSISALQVAADELVKQANSAAQFAASNDPLAWLAGDEDIDEAYQKVEDVGSLPPLVVTPLSALDPWGVGWSAAPEDYLYSTAATGSAASSSAASGRRPPPFAVDPEINGKIVLFEGDLCSLDVDALLAPAAAGYQSGASTIFPRILRHGGSDLRGDLRDTEQCRSGEARLCKAYGLPARWLLLTVGPKFKEKYRIAAQNTLNCCYRESLQLAVESGIRTIGIPCAWYLKGFPLEEQAHVGLRTLRRCLEHVRGSIDTIVLAACCTPQVGEFYANLLPLYFPRTQVEAEQGAAVLPDCCWNAWGDVSVEERRIQVSSQLGGGDADSDRECLFNAGDDDGGTFMNARSDADDHAIHRLEVTMSEAETPELAKQAALRYFRRARELRPLPEGSRFVYRARGPDRFGRQVVVLLGSKLPSLGVRDERTLPLFVKECELLQGVRFVIFYVHSGVSSLDSPHLEVLQEMLCVVGARYRGSLDQLLVLHPGLLFRAAFAVGRAMNELAASFWHNSVYFDCIADVNQYVELDTLQLPLWVRDDDPT